MKIDISVGNQIIMSDQGGRNIQSLKLWMPNRRRVFVFCLFAIRRFGPFPFDARFHQFGNAALVIKRSQEFVRRVEVAIESIAHKSGSGLVEYVHPLLHAGEMGPFRKFNHFEYQSEFRIAFEPLVERHGPVDLEIGPISDISELYPVQTLEHMTTSPATP